MTKGNTVLRRMHHNHHPTATRCRHHAFTLIELLIVIVILGICYGLVLPTMGDSKELRLREAARMLAADIELAQTESITHADDPRIVKFDTTNHQYWIAPASTPDTPITDTVRKESFLVSFGTGRASGTSGVTITAVNLDGDNEIHFDAYGTPDQTTNATITLACGPATMTIQIEANSGDVSVLAN